MSERISQFLRRAVAERAGACCEYCGMPEGVLALPHEPDHVIAVQHGGESVLENRAYTCFCCNRLKGPNLSSIDPQSGEIVRLFNPRADTWRQHFRWEEAKIIPLTDVGRATVTLLRLNEPERVTMRALLFRAGRYPFAQT